MEESSLAQAKENLSNEMENTIPINPKVLKWAREECGYTPSEIANKLHVPLAVYSRWETIGEGIELPQLVDLSRICKRQIAFFFLPNVPERTIRPTDFRNLELSTTRISDKTLLAFRRTEKFRDFLIETNGLEYYKYQYSWIHTYRNLFPNISYNIDNNSRYIRDLLEFPVEEQLSIKLRTEDSYNRWKNSIEQHLGIYVFQFSMPDHEVQGFSYSDSYPYCIGINNSYSVTSRTFTLFHELAHILNSQSGLCKHDDIISTHDNETEYNCNNFAGYLLVPSEKIVNVSDKDQIYAYATSFKISSEVYLRRLFSLGYLSEEAFFSLLYQIRLAVIPTQPHYVKSQVKRSINSRGISLFNSAVDAMNNKKISYSQTADILGIKINHILNY
ncbi:ImmA/IrrE family metallo-endopeptidase [Chloroflexota bacterium]